MERPGVGGVSVQEGWQRSTDRNCGKPSPILEDNGLKMTKVLSVSLLLI